MGNVVTINDIVARLVRARAEWLEAMLADLLGDGVGHDEIEVREYPDRRTVIIVRGVAKYEYRLNLLASDPPHTHSQDGS